MWSPGMGKSCMLRGRVYRSCVVWSSVECTVDRPRVHWSSWMVWSTRVCKSIRVGWRMHRMARVQSLSRMRKRVGWMN